jgi:MinD-like ATPase involved in chromosome partitioning or flagellar assembly
MPLGAGALLGDGGCMGNVIAFVPATGGTGSTTLAAAVAVRAAAAGRTSVVVDLDRLSGRLDVVLGIEQEEGWRWSDLAGVSGVVDGRALLRQLPWADGAAALSFGAEDLYVADSWGDSRADSRADSWADSGADSWADSWVASPGVAESRATGAWVAGSALAEAGESRMAGSAPVAGALEPAVAAYRLEDVAEWLERACDVVAGLREAADVVVLDCPRDERVLEALADEVDVVVLTVGTDVAQVASAAAAVPLVRVALDRVRLRPCGVSPGPLVPPLEPWVVLRGGRVDEELHDLLMDYLDVPVIGAVGDDRHVVSDLAAGRPPGARGRGPVVEMADRLLLRLVSQLDAA